MDFTIPRLAVLATAAALISPAAASADSIAYVKDGNVWLNAPDGSKTHQVTKDGTAASPYRSPSQADDGTIAVSHGTRIEFLEQNGRVLRSIDPPPLTDTTSHQLDGVPVDIAISPDGSKVAYQYASYSCPVGTACSAKSAVGITDTQTGTTDPATYSAKLYLTAPSWFSNTRLLAFDGYLHQVNTIDVGAGNPDVHWFDDGDTDLGDGEATRQGDKLAIVRGYDTDGQSGTHIRWYRLDGALAGGQPTTAPLGVCDFGVVRGTHDPTWSPDGADLAWADADGIHLLRGATLDPTQCGTQNENLIIAGASEPDFGPANVDPKPVTTQDPPTGNGGPTGDGGPTTPGTKFAVTVPSKVKLKAALKGLKLTVTAPGAGSLSAAAAAPKTVATGKAKSTRAGKVALKLVFSRAAKKTLAKKKSVRLAIKVTYKPAGGGAPQTVKRTVTLRR